MTPFLFFTGKGGVGKTSVACATAVRLARQGKRVLVVSTDPASNLDDVLGTPIRRTPTAIPQVERLAALNLDPEQAAADYRETMVAPFRGVLPSAAIASMEEQLSGACTVEIAAFNEFTRLLADPEVRADYDHVIFDTAPTGHTLRLLSLPAAWTGFIAANTTGTSCLGPLAGLEPHRARYAQAVSILADPACTTLVLVTRAEQAALREAARASAELRALGVAHQQLVLNGMLTDPGEDVVAQAYAERQCSAIQHMPAALAELPRTEHPLVPWELCGAVALGQFADGVVPNPLARRTGNTAEECCRDAIPGLGSLLKELVPAGRGVVMAMGKGGVGKTTLAVRLALALVHEGQRVHLTTTDPAAHVRAALRDALGDVTPTNLTVSRIDPAAEAARYSAEVLAAAGELDPAERALLEEDLRSPCTEEIAVFRAFARVIEEGAHGFVILDTAPTGHTLLLLDAAESYHREVARTSAGAQVPDAVRTLLPRLRDASFTKVLLVTHAERTPVQEAAQLQADLQRAGINPFGWVINASLAASGTTHPVLAARAALERPHIARVRSSAAHVWLVPWQAAPLEVLPLADATPAGTRHD